MLQTSLTISVYMTVTIAVSGWLYITPLDSRKQSLTSNLDGPIQTQCQEQSPIQNMVGSCTRGRHSILIGIVVVVILSVLFNISRWFEMEAVLEVS